MKTLEYRVHAMSGSFCTYMPLPSLTLLRRITKKFGTVRRLRRDIDHFPLEYVFQSVLEERGKRESLRIWEVIVIYMKYIENAIWAFQSIMQEYLYAREIS